MLFVQILLLIRIIIDILLRHFCHELVQCVVIWQLRIFHFRHGERIPFGSFYTNLPLSIFFKLVWILPSIMEPLVIHKRVCWNTVSMLVVNIDIRLLFARLLRYHLKLITFVWIVIVYKWSWIRIHCVRNEPFLSLLVITSGNLMLQRCVMWVYWRRIVRL